MSSPHRLRIAAAAVLAATIAGPAAAPAQRPPAARAAADSARFLSLGEAIRLAQRESEEVRVAEAGVLRASGEQLRARSQYLPQIYGSVGYTKTLKSQFEGAFGGGGDSTGSPSPPDTEPQPVCAPRIPPGATAAERQAALAQAITCEESNPFAAFSNLPFGQEHQWQLGLSLSQPLFSGGRIVAVNRIASAGRSTAEIALMSARAQLLLDVTQAYYDAVLADRLTAIADSALVQTETVLRQTTLARQVGTSSEFELLRARVTRDNQRPQAIQARTQREIARLRLKQLLNLPLDVPLVLTDALGDEEVPARVTVSRTAGADTITMPVPMPPIPAMFAASADTSADARATVRQAADAVQMQEGMVRIARAQRLPSVALTSQYGRVAYPLDGIPSWQEFLSNWTVGVSLQLPLFTGFRITGDERVARANLIESRARLQQTRELASLDAQVTLAQLAEAEASWTASVGTVSQAARAYQIAGLRYREGISTQVELSESRILMQQALANRAMAARNLAVARAKVALMRDLPLGAGGAGAGSSGAAAAGGTPAARSALQQLEQYRQQQLQQQQPSASGAIAGVSGGSVQ